MSIIEKAGATVLKGSFEKKKKKDKAARKPVAIAPAHEEEEAAAEREPAELDFAALSKDGVYNPKDRSSQLALELRAVKRRLLRRIGYLRASDQRRAARGAQGKHRNLILVTSTRAGEGKTFTAVNLALSLAFEDRIETLLVDADFARPKVRDRLGLPPAPGLADRLLYQRRDIEAMGWRIDGGPLSIVPEGGSAGRPADFLASESARALWADLAAENPHRLVIVDAPPVLAATDAVLLARHADEIVFVVEANSTPEAAVAAAVDELIDINPNVSLMLNRCQIGAGGAHYGSYEYYDRSDAAPAPAAHNPSSEG
jgi:protein-tyrosine kinase